MQKCRVCFWEGETEKIVAREMMYGTREEFDYFVCPKCGCLQIEKVPDDLGRHYNNENYYSFTKPSGEKKDVEKKYDTRILDVGCGAGFWLCALYEAGYTNLYGCDPFLDGDIEYENGVKIYAKSIHEMEGEFDIIRFGDSFEHVTDPHETLDSAKKLLAPKGHIELSLPIFPNIAYDMFGVDWYQLDAPRHIFLHSKKSLMLLAKLHGLYFAKMDYEGGSWMIERSFMYQKGIPFVEQTQEMFDKYFPSLLHEECVDRVLEARENEYVDHATVYLTRLEDGIPVFK